jgi:hypothetical protein
MAAPLAQLLRRAEQRRAELTRRPRHQRNSRSSRTFELLSVNA